MKRFSREYVKKEAIFTKKELDAFYKCNKIQGHPKKEYLRTQVLNKRKEFEKVYK